jgi:hypothetical protein
MATPKPSKADTYAERFVRVLNQDYRKDEACVRIGANKDLGEYCATMTRRYVDSEFTEWLQADRKARIGAYRANVVKAIEGFEAGANLYRLREPETAALLDAKVAELRGVLAGADELLNVKAHGRFRDHGILYCMRLELEKALGPVTNATLANLINTAQGLDDEAQGLGDEAVKLADAEEVRKNLDNFLTRNQNWDPPTGNSNP